MSKKVIELDPQDIIVPENRYRKEFDHGQMEELKQSMLEVGQLQPIRITRGKVLVVGERRLRACMDLGMKVQAIYVDTEDALLLLRMEYEENARRTPLTPTEDVLAVDRLYCELEEVKGKPPTHDEVAQTCGRSKTRVTEDLKFACFVKAAPQFFQKCSSKHEMRKTIGRLEQKVHFNRLERELDSCTTIKVKDDTKPIEIGDLEEEDQRTSYLRERLEGFRDRLVVGDAFEELAKLKDEVGVMLLDPPWGVGHNEKHKEGQSSYDDSQKAFEEKFPELLRLAYNAMSKDSHLYCFFGIVHHEFVCRALEEVGFFINRRPIIVCKEGRASTRAPHRWNGAGYEPVLLAHKGDRNLVRPGDPDWFTCGWLTHEAKLGHPNAKPMEAYQKLLLQSAYPGDFVCDPMFGTGAAFVACESLPELRLRWLGFDDEKDNRAKAIYNLSQFVAQEIAGTENSVQVGPESEVKGG